MHDLSADLKVIVDDALANKSSLVLRGGGSKWFYGRESVGQPLDLRGHSGIVSYEPTELVMTARCGTPLRIIEDTLEENNQMLAFEPPYFDDNATLGGAVATGLSGPRRPFGGAVRDAVLGVRILNGSSELLSFGGQVMKNVAGYDLSRLMTGSLGTLAIILQVSFKVMPRSAAKTTLVRAVDAQQALSMMNRWVRDPLPLSGLCWANGALYARLSGSRASLDSAAKQLGGDILSDGANFWRKLRDQKLEFFNAQKTLWRLSVAPATPMLDLNGQWLLDWGGAQRWLISGEAPERVFRAAAECGGHACRFRSDDRLAEVFQPLSAPLCKLHKQLKQAFDPKGIFNAHRMYRDV